MEGNLEERRNERRKDGWKEGWAEGEEGWMDRRKEGRTVVMVEVVVIERDKRACRRRLQVRNGLP